MCVMPRQPKIPQQPERQAVQVPQDPTQDRTRLNSLRRRGFWASIMTGPKGVTGAPSVTGATGKTGVAY